MIWVAWVGMFTIWLSLWSWMMGFGRLSNLHHEADDMPIRSIQTFSIFLCGMAVVEMVSGLFFILYGLGSVL